MSEEVKIAAKLFSPFAAMLESISFLCSYPFGPIATTIGFNLESVFATAGKSVLNAFAAPCRRISAQEGAKLCL